MIEISQIIFQIFLFIFLTLFPVNKFLVNQNSLFKNMNFFTSISINSLILMFLLLLFSFFKINLEKIFLILVILYSILSFKIILSKKKKIQFENWPLIIFFLFSLTCIFINTGYQFELGWDGFNWKEKANFFYNNGYLFDINKNILTDQNYPHLGTYIWAFFWKNSFLNYEYIGRLFYNYIYVTSIFAIILSFRDISNLKKIFIFTLIFFCTFDVGLNGYQDYLIFSILSIFAASLVDYHLTKNYYIFYLVYLLSGILLPWIKLEGFIYSLFVLIIFFIYELQLKKDKRNYLRVLFSMLIIFSLLMRISVNNILDGNTLFHGNLNDFIEFKLSFSEILNKIYYILFYLLNSFFKYPIWLFNLVGLLLSIYFVKNIKILGIFLLFFILNILFIFLIYLTSSANIIWYLSASLDRLILQTSGFYFVIFSLLNKKIIKF